MKFQQMQNIDGAFRSIRMFTLAVVAGCLLTSLFAIWKSYSLASANEQKIYVLANGKALEAYASDRKENIPIEARDHIKTFHRLFFTLTPDETAINANIAQSLYLADISAKQAYDNLKENNYFSNIIAGNVSQTINVDSIYLDINQYPFYFKCFAKQQITRSSSLAVRSLTTEGYLRNVGRSENNAHGFLIERWITLENQDLSVTKR